MNASIARPLFHITICLLLLLAGVAIAQQEDPVKAELFKEIGTALQAAQREGVMMFAPTLCSRAMSLVNRAESDYRKGERLDRIRETLRDALKTFSEAREVARVSRVALERVHQFKIEVDQLKLRGLSPDQFTEADREYRKAIIEVEDGDLRAAREKGEDACRSYRDAIRVALEKGPLAGARTRLRESEKRLGKEEFATAGKRLDAVGDLIAQAQAQEFSPTAFVADTRRRINDIVVALTPQFNRVPPDTLRMGDFVLVGVRYDDGRQWDETRGMIVKASGTGWTNFTCDIGTLFPLLSATKVLVSKAFQVVQVVRNPLLEVSLDEARLIRANAQPGELLQMDLPATADISGEIVRVRHEVFEQLKRGKGAVKVQFEDFSIAPTTRPGVGKVTEGRASYPTASPVPSRITLDVAGFTVYLDSLWLTPASAYARAELELPPSIMIPDSGMPARVSLGRIPINSSCQFYAVLVDSSYGPWTVENTGMVIKGTGLVADFSTTWGWRARPGRPSADSLWRGVRLINGSTVSPTLPDTSNAGYLRAPYLLENTRVTSAGLSAQLTLERPFTFVTFAPLGYRLTLNAGKLQIEHGALRKGEFNADGMIPPGATKGHGIQQLFHCTKLMVDSLYRLQGKADTIEGSIRMSERFTISAHEGSFFLPAAPAGLSPLFFDTLSCDRKDVSNLLDTLFLPGLTVNRFIDSMDIHSPDASTPISLAFINGWFNVCSQGVVGEGNVLSPEKLLDLDYLLGRPRSQGYKADSAFAASFEDTLIVDFVHNAVYNSYFKGNLTIPYPCGTDGVGLKIPYSGMRITSTGAFVGGHPVFEDTLTLDYWGVGITSRWGVVSVRTGEIIFTDAEITEPRHFSQGFNIYWGEMKADGNLGQFLFDFNSGNQKFDGFPLTLHKASLSKYNANAGQDPRKLLGYLEVTANLHLPFWGSVKETIKDYKYPKHVESPFGSRFVRIAPSYFALSRNWGSGKANMDFPTVVYDSLDQDGFRGVGNVTLAGSIAGTIPSKMDLNAIVTNINYCSSGISSSGGGSATPGLLTGAVGGMTLGPVGGSIQITGDKLERIFAEGPMEIMGSAGAIGLGVKLKFFGDVTMQVTPTSTTVGAVAGLSVGFLEVATVSGMAGIKLTSSTTGLKGDLFLSFQTSPVQYTASGQFSWAVGYSPSPLFYFQGAAKIGKYYFGTGTSSEGAMVLALNAEHGDLWALDKIGKKVTARDALEAAGIDSGARLTGFYVGAKYGGSISLAGIISGGYWAWGGAGCFFVSNLTSPAFVLIGNEGFQVTGGVLWGLLSATLYAELVGVLGIPNFSLCGSGGIDVCCCWDLLCFGWSGELCIGTNGISAK